MNSDSKKLQRLTNSKDISGLVADHDNFLLDCDGVIWAGGLPLKGAIGTIEGLRKAGKRITFITNNSSKSRRQYAEKLSSFGIHTDSNDIVTSGSAMANFLREKNINMVYCIGEEGLLEELTLNGIEYIADRNSEKASMDENEFVDLALNPKVKAVCVGWNRSFTFRHICIASAYLQNGCEFIGANPDTADS